MSSIEKHHRGGGKLGPLCGQSDHLQLDQACLQLVTKLGHDSTNSKFTFQAQSKECYKCSFWTIGEDLVNGTTIPVNTTYPTSWKLFLSNGTEICKAENQQFGQYGVYILNTDSCEVKTDQEPSNAYLPILVAAIVLISLQSLWSLGKILYKSPRFRQKIINLWRRNDSERSGLITEDSNDTVGSTNEETPLEERPRRKNKRVRSLDAFRGLAIVIMIFVNYGGGGYSFFAHARWNGLTVADLVFPWFMWIMGVSMVISIQSQLRNSISRPKLILNIVRRSATLIFLGLVINSIGNNDLRTFRIPGVLQRFGFAYLIVGIMQAIFAHRELPSLSEQHLAENTIPWWWPARDIKACSFQWILMLLVLALHSYLTFLLPVPGCPSGYLGPGGLQNEGQYRNCTGGSARYIDIKIFGREHIYQHPTAKIIYDTTEPFDPEGFLGSLTAIFLVFLGCQCGYTLLSFSEWKPRVRRWLAWALFLGIFAGGLCGFSKENGVIPFSKNLWSLSFTLGLASFAFILLTTMYLLIDVWNIWTGAPLFYAGMNPILLYVGHEICEEFFPFSWQPYSQSHAELLFMNLWGMSLWVLVAFFLHQKKIFVSI